MQLSYWLFCAIIQRRSFILLGWCQKLNWNLIITNIRQSGQRLRLWVNWAAASGFSDVILAIQQHIM